MDRFQVEKMDKSLQLHLAKVTYNTPQHNKTLLLAECAVLVVVRCV
jgi:hypothetical protein